MQPGQKTAGNFAYFFEDILGSQNDNGNNKMMIRIYRMIIEIYKIVMEIIK